MRERNVVFIRTNLGLILAHFRYSDYTLRYSTKITIPNKDDWQTGNYKQPVKKRRVLDSYKGHDEDYLSLNAKLDKIEKTILQIAEFYVEPIKIEVFKAELDKRFGRTTKRVEEQKPKKKPDVIGAFKEYVEHCEKTKKPTAVLISVQKLLERYAKNNGKSKIPFSALNIKFYDEIVASMENGEVPHPDTKKKAMKYKKGYQGLVINKLKMVLHYHRRVNPEYFEGNMAWVEDFKTIKGNVGKIHLEVDELHQLQFADLSEYPKLDIARDQFLLLAWTGQRFSDLDKLVHKNIKTNKEGIRVFDVKSQKTGEEVQIPISWSIDEILNKYDKMPESSALSTFNRNTKEACRMAGLTHKKRVWREVDKKKTYYEVVTFKEVGSHTARRSYVSNAILNGMNPHSIKSITGMKLTKILDLYDMSESSKHAKIALENPMYRKPKKKK